MGDMVEKTRKACVVVTNPTHVAVALYYDDARDAAADRARRRVTDLLAARMIVRSRSEEGIPVMQNVPLTRALMYARAELDQYVPVRPASSLMAEVLRARAAYRRRARRRRTWMTQRRHPALARYLERNRIAQRVRSARTMPWNWCSTTSTSCTAGPAPQGSMVFETRLCGFSGRAIRRCAADGACTRIRRRSPGPGHRRRQRFLRTKAGWCCSSNWRRTRISKVSSRASRISRTPSAAGAVISAYFDQDDVMKLLLRRLRSSCLALAILPVGRLGHRGTAALAGGELLRVHRDPGRPAESAQRIRACLRHPGGGDPGDRGPDHACRRAPHGRDAERIPQPARRHPWLDLVLPRRRAARQPYQRKRDARSPRCRQRRARQCAPR